MSLKIVAFIFGVLFLPILAICNKMYLEAFGFLFFEFLLMYFYIDHANQKLYK